MKLRLKRAYAAPAAEDGLRVLVDRLWPRGLRKSEACIDLWAKELAPSTELRKWFGHDPARWTEFRQRYQAELEALGQETDKLLGQLDNRDATLLYAAHDEERNNAVVLKDYLEKWTAKGSST